MMSGAFERGHDLLYICYDNEAYMNTGIQRSSATPLGAWTTTSPVGKVILGKRENRKDLTQCVAAHNIPYVAQASPGHWKDLMTKVQKALNIKGPAFMNVLSPCPRGWRYATDETVEIAKLAVETSFWPLYEIEYGKYRLTYKPKEKKPVLEWLKRQGRFKHLLTPENKGMVEEFQKVVDEGWERLLKHCQS
jgi:pyruvate ferredoxin oxidoreductase beta subunit